MSFNILKKIKKTCLQNNNKMILCKHERVNFMLGRNIKKYRLLSGYSMRDMADLLGVSHQTIKKYEDDTMVPNSRRLIQIAKLFKVKITDLVNDFSVPTLKYDNFRKSSSLSKKKEEGLQMLIADEIAKYLEVLNFADEVYTFDSKKWNFDVDNMYSLEGVATKVRKLLGISDECALDNLTNKLEDNNFLILEIDFEEKFDGFCEYVDDLAFIILSSKGYERNRFTLAHELGHLILNFEEDLDEKEVERYCDFFASCLLMPERAMKKELELGQRKLLNNISLNEIMLLAREYQVSLNAVIMRLYSLGIIDENKKRNLFIMLSKKGLRSKQLKLIDEHPIRENKLIFRLEAENIISKDEAIKYLGVTTDEYFRSDFSC